MSTNEKLAQALRNMLNITKDSEGVAGYRSDGKISDWGDFYEVDEARDALAAHESCADACESCAKACEAEKAQGDEPFGWMIEGSDRIWWGDFAREDAEQFAGFVGGTCRAFPIYRTAPAAPDAVCMGRDELINMLDDLVPLLQSHVRSVRDWREQHAATSAPASASEAPVAVPLTDDDYNRLAAACTPNTETGALNYRRFGRAVVAEFCRRNGIDLEGGQG